MFKLTSLNLNGIRSATSKGLEAWLESYQPDCICVQEVKAQAADVQGKFEALAGLTGYFHFAEKKGYSGVGIYSKHEPSDVIVGYGSTEFDAEGRYLELRFDRPGRKNLPKLSIISGDINIAHQEIDLKNHKGNKKNSGFLPEERAWMTRLLSEAGKVDVYRQLQPSTTDAAYTWWSNRGQAYANNVGWRLDYHLATPAIAALAKTEHIYKEQKFSDHAPMTVNYELTL